MATTKELKCNLADLVTAYTGRVYTTGEGKMGRVFALNRHITGGGDYCESEDGEAVVRADMARQFPWLPDVVDLVVADTKVGNVGKTDAEIESYFAGLSSNYGDRFYLEPSEHLFKVNGEPKVRPLREALKLRAPQ